MDNINKKIGEKIRKFRKEKNITIEDLADKSNMHFTYISRIELGRHSPTIEALEKISNALGIKIYQLLKSYETESDKEIEKIDNLLQKLQINELKLLKEFISIYINMKTK